MVREKWSRGEIPTEIPSTLSFIYAKAFIYAFDGVRKALAQLSKSKELPGPARSVSNQFNKSFPTLCGIRDSLQHKEDRARGRKGEKRINVKPIKNHTFNTIAGTIVSKALIGNRFGMTMGDGSYGEIEISSKSLSMLRDHLEMLFNALPWEGHSRQFPMGY